MQISFGKKIPINTCNIFNKESQKFERAVLYEIDCTSRSDIDYISSPEGIWTFKFSITRGAYNKYLDIKYGADMGNLKGKYYSIEAENGEIACLCETQPRFGNINIEYIESNPNKKYKYAGQMMLACISKLALQNLQSILIYAPSISARSFYSEICKFKEEGPGVGYRLPERDIKGFVKRTEKRTKGKIMDYKV